MTGRLLIAILFPGLSIATTLPGPTSYAKVSRNGQEVAGSRSDALSWIARALTRANASESEGRGIKNIAITVSPVYVAPRPGKLKAGEAVDHPSTTRYSTLDHEMLAQLDSAAGKKQSQQIQHRFHPPPSFQHKKPQNGGGYVPPAPAAAPGPVSIPQDAPAFPRPAYPGSFDYQPPDFLGDKPISKPISIDDYAPSDSDAKPPDSFEPMDSFDGPRPEDSGFPDFSNGPPSYTDDSAAPETVKFASPEDHRPPFEDSPYGPQFEHDHDIVYDQPPDFYDHHHHHHHHHEQPTEPPEPNDQRLDKRPYSYYFIGKKLWYVPLYFSIYFIIYIAALVLKSVARHKINFPARLEEVTGHAQARQGHQGYRDEAGWWDVAGRVLEGVESFAERFGKGA